MHTIVLDDGDLEVLSAALVELPFRIAAPLIDKINSQIGAGRRAAEKPAEKSGDE